MGTEGRPTCRYQQRPSVRWVWERDLVLYCARARKASISIIIGVNRLYSGGTVPLSVSVSSAVPLKRRFVPTFGISTVYSPATLFAGKQESKHCLPAIN